VNLIGEHIDCNDGLSLSFAVAKGVRVSARPLDSDEIVAHSLALALPASAEIAIPRDEQRIELARL
jgi:galactokinase